jgi:U4/U6.U5 tri-snRNP-associated protein 1
MNLDLAGQEEDAKNIDLKRKKREYDGYDDEEFDPGMLGVKKKVLSKYDVDIEGAQDGLLFLPLQENPSQLRS